MTMTYFTMVEKLNQLKGEKIRLSTQMDELERRQKEELQKLEKFGVTDAAKATAELAQEQTMLMSQIETSLRSLENV